MNGIKWVRNGKGRDLEKVRTHKTGSYKKRKVRERKRYSELKGTSASKRNERRKF